MGYLSTRSTCMNNKSIDFISVEEFGTFLLDEGRVTFTFKEAEGVAKAMGQSVATLVIGSKSMGLRVRKGNMFLECSLGVWWFIYPSGGSQLMG